MAASEDLLTTVVIAGAAGAGTAFAFWLLFRIGIDRQVTQTIEREVPPRIRAELDTKLRQYGLTPEVGAAIARLTSTLDQAGIWRQLATAGQTR